ncbi:MAG: hypothetical protein GY718_09475, partial [Lentisphaerae bacterium]|nr:hypothetical protein [Lentisphaerota bacterium]
MAVKLNIPAHARTATQVPTKTQTGYQFGLKKAMQVSFGVGNAKRQVMASSTYVIYAGLAIKKPAIILG